jgi:mRNA-degrading endonuclease toxin of MazEF toxin-antitoxin module
MAKELPYTATTATGEQFDVSFPLHPETLSPVRVANIISAVLEALDREVRLDPNTGNGDLLQGVAMALAIRSAMIAAPKERTDQLTLTLVRNALAATDKAVRRSGLIGHA